MSDEHGKKHRKKNEAKHKADGEQEREKDRVSEKDERRKSKSKGKRKELKDKSRDTDKATTKRSKPSKNSKVKKKQREASSSSSPTTAASSLPLREPFQAEKLQDAQDAGEPGSQLIDCVASSQAGESSEQIIDNYGGYQSRWIEDGEGDKYYEEEEGGNWLMEEELLNEEMHKLEEFDTRLETMSTNEIKFLIRDLARGLEADSDDTLEPHLGAGSTHGALLPSPQQPLAESTPMRAYPAEIHFPFVKIEGTPRQTFAGVSSGPVTLIPRFLSSELNQADLFI